MAYDPSLSTDRDALRAFLGDTNDAEPAFGLDEDGYDAHITRFGLTGTAIILIDQKIIAIKNDAWTDGDVSVSKRKLWEFWMQKRDDIMSGRVVPAGGAIPAAGSLPLDEPDLTTFEAL